MKLSQLPTIHLDGGHSLRLSGSPLVHSHEAICHPFFLRSTAKKDSFGHQRTYNRLLPVYKHSRGLFLSSLDLTLTLRLRHLKNHLLSLYSPYFARLLFFTQSLPFPWFLYYHLAPDSSKLILSPGFIIPNLSHIPLILFLHSLGCPVLLSPFPVSFLRPPCEAGCGERPLVWERGDLGLAVEPV